MYKIGTFKNGQQIADEVYASNNLDEIKDEFKRMWESTTFDPDGIDAQANNSEQAWIWKQFTEDTNNVAVFVVDEYESLETNYHYTGRSSKIMK